MKPINKNSPNPDAALMASLRGEDANITSYSAKGQICNENIVTTRDRAALVFHEYVKHRAWTTDWLAYLGVSVGLLLPLMTSEFKGLKFGEKVLLSGEACKGLVMFLCAISVLACVCCLARRFYFRRELKCGYFLEQLKKTTVNVD